MPLYPFRCDECNFEEEVFRNMKDAPGDVLRECPDCPDGMLRRDWKAQAPQVSAFVPYIEHNFDGTPIEVTGPKQRDELCEKHGGTYDSFNESQYQKPREEPVVTDEVMKQVYEETQGGKKLPDDVREACDAAEQSD